MANMLSVTNNYDNPYEKTYKVLSQNPFFNKTDWDTYAKRGDLPMYVNQMSQVSKLGDFDTYNNEKHLDMLTTDERFIAISNELYGNKDNADTEREETFYNDETGKEETKKFNMSDYDYINYMLEDKVNAAIARKTLKDEKERKDSMNWFPKTMNTLGAIAGEVLSGVATFGDDTLSLMEGIYDGFSNLVQGKDFEEGFRNAFNTGENGSADWRIFNSSNFSKSLQEWERQYTYMRDVNGNFTNFGKIAGQSAYSIGLMLPSMGVVGITGKVAGKASSAFSKAGKAAQTIYFVGLGSDNMVQLASDPSFATTPTYQLIMDAAMKSTAEFLIMRQMNKMFGPSSLDSLVFGKSLKSVTGSNLLVKSAKRFASDFAKEGLEETLQQFSNYLVDSYFAMSDQNFGQISNWNFQTMMDAFIIGGISTVGINVIDVVTTKRLNTGTKKINKLSSWAYKGELQSFIASVETSVKDKSLSDEQRMQSLGQAYATYRTLASVYGELGEQRFSAAAEMLSKMYGITGKSQTQVNLRQNIANKVFDELNKLHIDAVKKEINKTVDNLQKDGVTDITTVINKTDNVYDDNKIDKKTASKINDILNGSKNISAVVVTNGGSKQYVTNGVLFTPLEFVKNGNSDIMFKNIAEQKLVQSFVSEKSMQTVVSKLKEVYLKTTNLSNVDDDEVVYNLFFNDTFYNIALHSANKEMLSVISMLDNIATTVLSKNLENDIYKKVVSDVSKNIKIPLFNYLINQQYADIQNITVLTNKQKQAIIEKRWSKDLRNRVVKGEKLSNQDIISLEAKINSIPTDKRVKTILYNNIRSKNTRARTDAMSTIENYYSDLFLSEYNDKVYLQSNSVPNATFNQFLKEQGLTIDTMEQSKPSKEDVAAIQELFGDYNDNNKMLYYKQTFEQFTGNMYTFTYDKGKVDVSEIKQTTDKTYTKYKSIENKMYNDKTQDLQTRTFTTLSISVPESFYGILSKDISNVVKGKINISNVIYDTSLLSLDSKRKIQEEYGNINPQSIYFYLRKYFIDKTKTKSLSIMDDGRIIFVDVSPMKDVLIDDKVNIASLLKYGEVLPVSRIVKPIFLSGRAVDAKVKLSKNENYYSNDENTIYLSESDVKSNADFSRFAFLHEFQHVIQTQNKFNLGFNTSLILNNNISIATKKRLVSDIKKHVPDIFDKNLNFQQELNIAAQYVYNTSNEMQANGIERLDGIDLYPTVVNGNANGITSIVLPWGSKYILDEVAANQSKMSLEKSVIPSEFAKEDVKTKTMRKITITRAGDTNLKYFVKKQIDADLQNFVINADEYQLEPELWAMIGGEKLGTLTKQKAYDWFRNASDINAYTFNLFNKSFWNNKYLTTFKKLKQFTEQEAAKYFAIRKVLSSVNMDDAINQVITSDKMIQIAEVIKNSPDLKSMYNKYVKKYNTFNGEDIIVDESTMRISAMNKFAGTISSAANVANIARLAEGLGWKKAGKLRESNTSIKSNDEVVTEEQYVDETEFGKNPYDLLVDKEDAEELNELTETATTQEMELAVFGILKRNAKNTNLSEERLMSFVESMSSEQLESAYIKTLVAESKGNKLSEKTVSDFKSSLIRPRVNVIDNVKAIGRRISNIVSRSEFKKFSDEDKKLFNNDMTLKRELYVEKSKDELIELETKLKQIRQNIYDKSYESVANKKMREQLDKAKRKLEIERSKRFDKSIRTVKVSLTNETEFSMSSATKIPPSLKEILNTSFDEFRHSDVKYVTKDGDTSMKMNFTKFLELNASKLSRLNQQEVDDIIIYFTSAIPEFTSTKNDIIRFESFKKYILAYILNASKSIGVKGTYVLTAAQYKNIEDTLQAEVEGNAVGLAVWRSVLQYVNPTKKIIQQLARSTEIELSEFDLDRLAQAVDMGNAKDIKEISAEIEKNALAQHRDMNKSFFGKLWKFQRVSMLSSVGTMIRNWTSNTFVMIGNSISDVIGKLLPNKKYKIAKSFQYKLQGTKTLDKYKAFIDKEFIQSGLFNIIQDGLSKFDVRGIENKNTSNIIVDNIARSIINNTISQHQFSSNENSKLGKAADWYGKIVFKMMSDDLWINKRAKVILGKMMTESNFNTSEGLNKKSMELLVEAYTLASYEFMHRPNFFNKVEDAIKHRAGEGALFLYKQVLPFAVASWNWFLEGIKYTPIGLVKSIVDFAKLEKGIEKIERQRQIGDKVPSSRFAEYLVRRSFGKGVLGTVGFTLGIILASAGIAAIDEDDGKIYLQVADVKVDISKLFGVQGIFMGIAVTNTMQSTGNFEKSFKALADQFLMQSILEDMYNTFSFSTSPGDWLIRQTISTPSMLVPNIVKMVTRLTYWHEVDYSSGIVGQLERLAAQSIPGVAYAFPSKINPYTGETLGNTFTAVLDKWVSTLSPIGIATKLYSDVEKEAMSLGINKGMLTGKYSDIGQLSDSDVEKINIWYGNKNKQDLSILTSNKIKYNVQAADGKYYDLRYSQMTDEQKKRVIERIMSNNSNYAKVYIWTSNGGKYYTDESTMSILRKLGMANVYKSSGSYNGFMN